jgi:hypothetical protein
MKLEPAQAELKCIVDCPYAEKLQEKRVNDKLNFTSLEGGKEKVGELIRRSTSARSYPC